MSKLIWLFRYAWYWKKTTGFSWLESWDIAKIHCEEFKDEDFNDYHPVDCAIEEMSYWND